MNEKSLDITNSDEDFADWCEILEKEVGKLIISLSEKHFKKEANDEDLFFTIISLINVSLSKLSLFLEDSKRDKRKEMTNYVIKMVVQELLSPDAIVEVRELKEESNVH